MEELEVEFGEVEEVEEVEESEELEELEFVGGRRIGLEVKYSTKSSCQ